MENDLGRQLLYLESDILSAHSDKAVQDLVNKAVENSRDLNVIVEVKKEWEALGRDRKINLYDREYRKVVLTPLLMDFNYKGFVGLEEIHYNLAPRKPVIDQYIDLVSGIMDYTDKSPFQILEIFPFLGLNTKNYELGAVGDVSLHSPVPNDLAKKVCCFPAFNRLAITQRLTPDETDTLLLLAETDKDRESMRRILTEFDEHGYEKKNNLAKMLHKYFGNYRPNHDHFAESFRQNFIEKQDRLDKERRQEMERSLFAGIKVYPPLDFDPWPEDNEQELQKVNFLYQLCSEKHIPLTTHCNDNGFLVIDQKVSWKYSSPFRWIDVLAAYPRLKINFAHFGGQEDKKRNEWRRKIIEFVLAYEYVYADFSYSGVSKEFYGKLRGLLDGCPPDVYQRLIERLMFGTDFMIHLMHIRSYREYVHNYFITKDLSDEEKNLFCSENPEKFLFK
ncbi:amidohydrolase family protein [Acidobacteriota bacterium]